LSKPNELDANQIQGLINQAKTKFAANKGQADQIISDSVTHVINVLTEIIGELLRERSLKQKQRDDMEKELQKFQKGKKIQQLETETKTIKPKN